MYISFDNDLYGWASETQKENEKEQTDPQNDKKQLYS